MAHTLTLIRINEAGTETSIAAMGATLVSYDLRSRALAEVLDDMNLTVKETAEYTVTPASVAALKVITQAIEAAFLDAQSRERNGTGDRIFIKWQPSGAAAAYRSEVIAGSIYLDEDALDWQWAQLKIDVTVSWERRAWWEAAAESEVALTNTFGSGTGGMAIRNHDDSDAGDDSYVDIAAASVVGVLPAACRLEIKNDWNDAVGVRTIYAGHNVHSLSGSSGNMSKQLEAENGTGGTATASAAASAGYYKSWTWSGVGSEYITRLTLTNSMLNAARGRHFRVLARTTSYGSETADKFQFQMHIATNDASLWQSPWVRGQAGEYELQVLGTVQIPPGLTGYTGLEPHFLDLYVKGDDNVAHQIDIDFLAFLPLDGYRTYKAVSTVNELEYNTTLVDDGLDIRFYERLSTLTKKRGFAVTGKPIMLYPGKDQELVFYHYCGATVRAAIARALQIRLYYRPRYVTI